MSKRSTTEQRTNGRIPYGGGLSKKHDVGWMNLECIERHNWILPYGDIGRKILSILCSGNSTLDSYDHFSFVSTAVAFNFFLFLVALVNTTDLFSPFGVASLQELDCHTLSLMDGTLCNMLDE